MINADEKQSGIPDKPNGQATPGLAHWLFTGGIALYVLTGGWSILVAPFTEAESFYITGLILLINSVAMIGLLLMVAALVGFLQMSRTGWVFLRAVAVSFLLVFLILNILIPTLQLLPDLFYPQPISQISLVRWFHALFFVAALLYYQIPGSRKVFNLKDNDNILAVTLGIMLAIMEIILMGSASFISEAYMVLFY